MPRVHYVKKARKDNPAVKAGEPYFWWKFRYGGKRYSKTRPRNSQLTQSAYFSSVYSLQEYVEDFELEDPTDMETLVDEVRSQIEDLRDETQSSLDNMPESLQYSPTGELLQERVDALDNVESELDYIDEFDFDEEEFDEPEPDPEDYDDDEDYQSDLNDWEANKAQHERDEEERRKEELQSYIDEAKSTITEALDSAIV